MMNIRITVAIPTYQRTERLLARVRELLPQMGEGDCLVISDNASEGFAAEAHPELSDGRITLHVNPANVGANANIARCFERCYTDWMWLLGDDDVVLPGAMARIREEITVHANACYINFTAEGIGRRRGATKVVSGLGGFLESNDGFANTLLISNNVYNLPRVRPYLKFAYAAIWTNAPHIAPVLKALEKGDSAVYSQSAIVDWTRPNMSENWTVASVFNLVHLVTILETPEHAKALRRVVIAGLPRVEFLVLQLCYMVVHYGDKRRVVEYAQQILTAYIACGDIRTKTRAILLRQLVKYPCLVVGIASIAYRVIKLKSIEDAVQNRRFFFYL